MDYNFLTQLRRTIGSSQWIDSLSDEERALIQNDIIPVWTKYHNTTSVWINAYNNTEYTISIPGDLHHSSILVGPFESVIIGPLAPDAARQATLDIPPGIEFTIVNDQQEHNNA